MQRDGRRERLAKTIESCARAHVARGAVAPEAAEYAAATTLRALGDTEGPGLERRARAYFRAVARRRTVRAAGSSAAAARLIARSVVEDLVESGRTLDEAWEEIVRGWSDKLPDEVIEEYRSARCA